LTTSISIPQKSSFKFAELTSLTGVKPYVIRFWETEFPEISPVIGEDGQKVYSRSDVEILLKIKALLFEHKLSLQEAKAAMSDPDWKIHAPQIVSKMPLAGADLKQMSFNVMEMKSSLEEALSTITQIKIRHHW
jgi:DNA-binding transcriptional MerR regulator